MKNIIKKEIINQAWTITKFRKVANWYRITIYKRFVIEWMMK